MTHELAPQFRHSTYVVRRKIFSFPAHKFHVYDESGGLICYSKQKAFKLKEDVRIYTDESMSRELIVIKARNIIDLAATYDIYDSISGEPRPVGALRRKAMKSIIADEWLILDAAGREIGMIKEDSMALALVRRLIAGPWLPQHYTVQIGGKQVAEFRRNFNPFVSKMKLDFSGDPSGSIDRRVGLAAGILLVGIEGKQQG